LIYIVIPLQGSFEDSIVMLVCYFQDLVHQMKQ
jgi:hypothetical protein